jgi:hypothetical protein
MAVNNAVNKGIDKLKAVLALVESGEYRIINGNLYKGNKRIKGSLGSIDKQIWYNVKGNSVLGYRLAYAYYNGLDDIKAGKLVKHLDGELTNNAEHNLIAVNKKGYVKELAEARIGLKTDLYCPLNAPQATAKPEGTTPNTVTTATPQAEENVQLNGEELTIAIWNAILEGGSNADITQKYNVKTVKVNDIRRGKSGVKTLKKYGLV